jgi:hypothetical protein
MEEPLLNLTFSPTSAQYKRILRETHLNLNKKYKRNLIMTAIATVIYFLLHVFQYVIYISQGWGVFFGGLAFAFALILLLQLRSGGLLPFRFPKEFIRFLEIPNQYLFFDTYIEFRKATDAWFKHETVQWGGIKTAVRIKGDFILLADSQIYFWLPHENILPEQAAALHALLTQKLGGKYVCKGN